MKLVALIFALLPLTGFTAEMPTKQPQHDLSSDCNDINATDETKKNCLLEEKQKDAAENFRNFQENNHLEKTI